MPRQFLPSLASQELNIIVGKQVTSYTGKAIGGDKSLIRTGIKRAEGLSMKSTESEGAVSFFKKKLTGTTRFLSNIHSGNLVQQHSAKSCSTGMEESVQSKRASQCQWSNGAKIGKL